MRGRRFGENAEYGGEAAVRAEAGCAEKQGAVFGRAAAQRADGGDRRGGGERAKAVGKRRRCSGTSAGGAERRTSAGRGGVAAPDGRPTEPRWLGRVRGCGGGSGRFG
jgi:hypothetical protein